MGWSPADQLAAAVNVLNESEACPGCGLRPDQHHQVEADLTSCPGCEARAAAAKDLTDKDRAKLVGFFPVADTRESAWARYTLAGSRWRAQHRHTPPGLIYDPQAED